MGQRHESARAGRPVRKLLVVLLLAGFGLWQAWQCTDGMMASPITGMTSMHTAMATTDGDHGPAGTSDMTGTGDEQPMPAGLVGLCITVLASFAAALLLMAGPLKVLALLRRAISMMVRPVSLAPDGPDLSRLCISRT